MEGQHRWSVAHRRSVAEEAASCVCICECKESGCCCGVSWALLVTRDQCIAASLTNRVSAFEMLQKRVKGSTEGSAEASTEAHVSLEACGLHWGR